jgi:hypothetical protein
MKHAAETIDLFEFEDDAPSPKAHARHTDPDTSHVAAARASIALTAKQEAVLAVFETYINLTDVDLIRVYEIERREQRLRVPLPQQSESGLRTRRSELVRKGKLVRATKIRLGDAVHSLWKLA